MTKETEKFTPKELSLVIKALQGLKATLVRAKTKEAADAEMTAIYDTRIREVDVLISSVATKEMF